MVRCPKCNDTFRVAPTDLFVIAIEHQSPSDPATLPNDRVSCKHMKSCSGCSVTGVAQEPPTLNEIRSFLDRFGVRQLPVYIDSVHHWRTHAKLAIRGAQRSQITLGLFRSNSHEVQPIPECTVHAPEINDAVNLVQSALRESTLYAYNEATGKGQCRYALFTVHRPSRKVQVTIVWNAASWKESNPESMQLAAEIWRRGRSFLHSLWFNWNNSTGNVIVCPEVDRFYHVYGEKSVMETICGVQIAFPPYAFRQANLDAFEKLVLPKLLSYIPIGANVAEFCAGVGVIGLTALKNRKLRQLSSSEIMDGGRKPFRDAYNKLRKEGVQGKASYIVGSDSDTMDIVQPNTDVVIVDPPRGGLSEDVVEFLANPVHNTAPTRIVYLSCGANAFKNDARVLLDGQWRLTAAHAFILFPGSNHVELLAIFDRKRKPRIHTGRQKPSHDSKPRRKR
ncbi:putative RNA methyltransferase pc1998 [Gracilariopsis chorda]|uniref:Putative RNA methyltransferase pc1998 n=1 Tax=Gracilariopsis chorda TaxID=448386 RepID=A0A2V3J5F4_9FLOR|nr:putative RNA methyltransferase pc1998 [Gracilariopsis chorda]|eukprot:PXF49543.1 putative RNA methyltransferase pc1998 [Gracilariopsis chorda]